MSLDDFYIDRGYLSAARRARLNFDHPRSIDWPRLEQVLSSFASGAAARVPRYDFATHSRLSLDTTLAPGSIIIIEGLWLFRRASIRRHLDLKVFITGPASLCEERRLQRDIRERGRTPEQVREQWRGQTRPMFERFVAPQERWADITLEAPISEQDVLNLAGKIEEISARETRAVGI